MRAKSKDVRPVSSRRSRRAGKRPPPLPNGPPFTDGRGLVLVGTDARCIMRTATGYLVAAGPGTHFGMIPDKCVPVLEDFNDSYDTIVKALTLKAEAAASGAAVEKPQRPRRRRSA